MKTIKLSPRQKEVFDIFVKFSGSHCTIDDIHNALQPLRKPLTRNNTIALISRVREKVELCGSKIEKRSKVGRTHKGIFFVPEEISGIFDET